MRKHSWLFLRKERDGTHRYYLRARVPVDLVEVIGRREIKRSLRTGDRREAARRINQEAAEIERLFEAARRRLRQETVTSLTEAEIRQIALSWFHSRERGEARRRWSGQGGEIGADALLEYAQDEAVLLDPEDPSVLAGVQDIADRLLEENHARLDRTDPAHRLLCELVRRALLEASRRSRARLQGDPTERHHDDLFAGLTADRPQPQAAPSPRNITLDQLIERFVADPARSHLQDKTSPTSLLRRP